MRVIQDNDKVPEQEDAVYQRLNSIVDNLENGNQAEFARRIGVRSGVVGDMFGKRRNKPSFDVLAKLSAAYPQLRVEWLLLGEGEMLKSAIAPKAPVHHPAGIITAPNESGETEFSNSTGDISQQSDKEEVTLNKIQILLKQLLLERKAHQHETIGLVPSRDYQLTQIILDASNNPLPDFDQHQIDKRFLNELDRLLKAKAFLSYKDWAQAVGVSPSYVAAFENGRYHFNIELLYNTIRHFPAFDFIYVIFGSAWSARPEPIGFPKRTRGPRPKSTK